MVSQPLRWPLGRARLLFFALMAIVVVGAASSSAVAADVVDRDEYSTTVELADKKLKTTVSAFPLNFQNDAGAWREIDTELEEVAGGDLQPKSIDGDLTIPESLSDPIELEHDGKDVSFRLIGASAGADAEADGAEATFDGVLSGVNASYVARPFGVKETLELTSASSPRVFTYDLRAYRAWAAAVESGDVVLRDSAGAERYRITAPLAWDSANDPAFTNSLALTVSKVSDGRWRVTLRPDAAWLADAARVFPVHVDPEYAWSRTDSAHLTAQADCQIASGSQANTKSCAWPLVYSGYSTRSYRGLFKFNVAAAIDNAATVTNATFKAYSPSTSTRPSADFRLHTVTSDWDSNATWNSRKTSTPWTTAGGDYSSASNLTSAVRSVGTGGAWYSWDAPLAAVQGWVAGTLPNYGFLLKTDATSGLYDFVSTEEEGGNWPTLDVTYTMPDVTVPSLTLSGQLLTGQTTWRDAASGTITLSATDSESGVQRLELTKGTTQIAGFDQACPAGGCSLSHQFTLDFAALGDGFHQITASAIDASSRKISTVFSLRIDRGPPNLALTGSLVDDQNTVAASGSRSVHIVGSDTGSGVTKLEVAVDGINKHQVTQTCPSSGGCSQSTDYTLDLSTLTDGNHTVTVTATDKIGHTKTQNLTVKIARYAMPTAPPLPTTEAAAYIDQVSWLWTGSNPLITGVAAGTIEPKRAAVVTGKVFNDLGQPAAGVKVTVVDHPEFGQTLSRDTGEYFLAVNGGQDYRIRFELQGALSSDREVHTEWARYAALEDVTLVTLDNKTTPVTFGSAATQLQVASGSTITDQDGTRTVRALIRPGTEATVLHADGTTSPLVGGDMRFTEYTVGTNGPERMPAALPATSQYTWAASFRIDQAATPNDLHVQFSKPVVTYVDNFINQPVGLSVPAATYEKSLGRWIGDPDGRIIKIIGVDSQGRAILDVTGFGAANAGELANLDIDNVELEWLAQTYSVGKTLSRTQAPHFSEKDHNYPWLRKKRKKKNKKPDKEDKDNPCEKKGSIIGCQDQSLGETVDLGGTPYSLRYSSNRTPGAFGARSIRVPLTEQDIDSDLQAVQADVLIAGQRLTYRSTSPTTNMSHTFRWDGKDAFGRTLVGGAVADVIVHNVYPAPSYADMMVAPKGADPDEYWEWVYPPELSGGSAVSFAGEGAGELFGGGRILRSFYGTKPTTQPVDRPTLQCSDDETACWYPEVGRLESSEMAVARDADDNAVRFAPINVPYADQRSFGIGGWGISDLHRYDPATGTLFSGDGTQRSASELPLIVETVHTPTGNGDLDESTGTGIAALPDGSILRADNSHHRVLRDWPDGHTTVFAGAASRTGTAGDGGPATAATLNTPIDVAVAPDGSAYIADVIAGYVRKVTPDGNIHTVAGRGATGGDGANLADPLQRRLYSPRALAVAPDGTLYIGDQGGLFRLNASGQIARIGDIVSQRCVAPPNNDECIFATSPVQKVAVDSEGTVYWTGNDGTVLTYLFRWTPGDDEAELLMAANRLNNPTEGAIAVSDFIPKALEIDDNDRLWIAADDAGGQPGLYRVGEDNRITRIGLNACATRIPTPGADYYPYKGEGGPLRAACGNPLDIARGPDGMYIMDDSGTPDIRRIRAASPDNPVGSITIPSDDGGEAYVFTDDGRQTATRDGVTGRITRTFAYDAQGRVATITESDLGATTFAYDAQGNVTVTGPDGQVTTLAVDGSGFATEITDATGASQHFDYTAAGLMTKRTNELGDDTTFTWNAVGRLLSDTTPLGHTQTLARSETIDSSAVTHTDATGVATTYRTDDDGNDQPTSTVTEAAGTSTVSERAVEAAGVTQTRADGTSMTAASSGDPRWKEGVTHATSETTLPDGQVRFQQHKSEVTRSSGQNPNNPFEFTTLFDTETTSGASNTDRRTWTSAYNRAARTLTRTTPLGRTTTTEFDADDRPVRVSTAGRDDVELGYDGRGRITSLARGDGQSSFAYGTDGRVSETVDAEGRVTLIERDAAGRATEVVKPDGTTIGFEYDAAGRVTKATAPDGRETAVEYDAEGHAVERTQTARPGSGDPALTSTAEHDAAGRATVATRPSGEEVALSYDTSGRIDQLEASDGTSNSMTYGAVVNGVGGQLESVEASNGAETTITHNGSLPKVVTSSGDAPDASGAAPTVAYSYDSSLRTASIGVGTDVLSYSYNDDDQITKAGQVELAYDSATGDATERAFGNTSTLWATDTAGEVAGLQVAAGAAQAAYSETVLRDKLGRITQRTSADDSGTHIFNYAYDAGGRLAEVKKDGAVAETYAYDASGALVTRGAGLLAAHFGLDGYGRPLTTPDGNTLTWSTDGELTSSTSSLGGTTNYEYDGFGRLTGVELPGGETGSYHYDALGHRTEVSLNGQIARRYVYGAGDFPQARIDAAGDVIERYVYASNMHVPDAIVRRDGQKLLLTTDSTGSVRIVLDADTGQTLQRIDYDAYGRVTRDTNPGLQPFGYKGSITDPLSSAAGLSWMGVRAYQASMGRFTTPDIAGLLAGWNQPDAFAGDPINRIDPNGAISTSIGGMRDVLSTGSTLVAGVAGVCYMVAAPTGAGLLACGGLSALSTAMALGALTLDLIQFARGEGDPMDAIFDVVQVVTGTVGAAAKGILTVTKWGGRTASKGAKWAWERSWAAANAANSFFWEAANGFMDWLTGEADKRPCPAPPPVAQ